MSWKYIESERLDSGRVVRITLDRARARNAQNRGLLVELGEAFTSAEEDDEVRVVVLRGAGPMFSSGHDLGSRDALAERDPDNPAYHRSYSVNGGTRKGAEMRMLQEWHYFYQNTLRWRNLRKITIAEVHGTVFAAGLMLAWCCDLIVAAEGTTFADVVGTRLGMCGLEYFAHPWELGPRKAKELLLLGDSIDADEAYRLGMVSKVFAADELSDRTVELAQRVARVPSMASLLIKESVNQSVDNMGFYNALQACFTVHQLNHSHWAEVHGPGVWAATAEDGVPPWQEAPPVVPATKDQVRASSPTN